MSGLLLSRIDSTKLYPPFLAALTSMLDECLKDGVSYWAISGFRTYGAQTALWQQGRSLPGSIVTHAMGGQSAHCFGIAADLVRDVLVDRAGIQPDYAPEAYEMLRTVAPKHGLVWGGSWKFRDNAHVQLPRYVTADDLKPLREQYEKSGLLGVFQFLDQGVAHV